MSYAMLWLESLLAALLLVATVAACVARWPRRWARWSVLLLVALPLLALTTAVTVGTGFLKFSTHLQTDWFSASLTWTLLFTAGMVVLCWYGLARSGDQPPRAHSWPRGQLVLGFAAATVLLYITYSNLDLAMKMQRASLRAEAGAKLLALTPPRVPDAENAAFIYQEAFDNLTPLDKLPPAWQAKSGDWFDREHKRFDPKDKDLLAYLASQERALKLLEKASPLPHCVFDRDYSENISMLMPELEKFLRAADLLALHAVTKAATGDYSAALSDIDTIFRIARHANEPILIAVLTSFATERKAVRALEEVLAYGPQIQVEPVRPGAKPEEPAPRRLQARELDRTPLMEMASHRREVVQALQMEEAAFGLAFFGMLGDEPELTRSVLELMEGKQATGAALTLWHVFHMPDDLAAYRRNMTEMRRLADGPYHENHVKWQGFEHKVKTRREGIVTSMIMPHGWKCAVAAAEADAHRRLARLAIAATLYKAKHGKYPTTMDELVPQYLPQPLIDPFTGKPLRLWADGDGLILSSVRPVMPWDKETRGDIVFRLK